MSMFLEVVKTEYLAHLSYLIGHGSRAAVIDPRRDADIYVEMANRRGARITSIFETHRNEDYVIGSQELAQVTGAQIYHGHQLNFEYGNPVREGDEFSIGGLKLRILETPGHTFESISIVVIDATFGSDPVAVFTGDALFIGDVGRTDFFPDRKEEVAGLLYDSIFNTLLPLGDHVILYPAHGAGSVCGSGMAEREFSTLGYEKRNNPSLQVKDKNAFIQKKIREQHNQPPYFRKMEEYNQKGNAPLLGCLPEIKPLQPNEFAEAKRQDAQIIDSRSPEAISGAFIPGSLALPVSMISAYGGYFLDYDKPIGLVVADREQARKVQKQLLRIGYDNIVGYLADELQGWERSGRKYDRIPAVHAQELVSRIDSGDDFLLLDVRKDEEFAGGHLPGARHIFLGNLLDTFSEIPKDKPIVTFCGSGIRAIVAASILKRAGFQKVENALGSMAACRSFGCPLEKEEISGVSA